MAEPWPVVHIGYRLTVFFPQRGAEGEDRLALAVQYCHQEEQLSGSREPCTVPSWTGEGRDSEVSGTAGGQDLGQALAGSRRL